MTALVVGIGRMGARHVRVLGELGLTPITVDPIAEGATYQYLDQVSETVDVACVAVPITALADVAIDVIEHITPRVMLLEKPGADHSSALARVNEAAMRRHVRVVIGYTERFNPVVRMLAKLLHDHTLPAIDHVAATRFSPDAALSPIVPHEVDLAVHDIDIAWRYAHEGTFSWFGGYAPVRSRMFTCIHGDGGATVLDLDNRLINGVEIKGEEPLRREWRYAINLKDGHVPLWPEIEVLEAAERMTEKEPVAA